MKNIRNIVIGVIIGILITSSFAFGADIIRNSYFNPDLKLAINGKPVQDLRIVTVELEDEQYGRNYYSIADLVKAFNDYGGVNIKVDFDSNTKTTIVEVEQKEAKTIIIPTPEPIEPTRIIESNNSMEGGENDTMEVTLNKYGLPDFSKVERSKKPEIETDGEYYYFIYNDVKYILVPEIYRYPRLQLPEPYRFECPIVDGKFLVGIQLVEYTEEDRKIIIDDIPYAAYDSATGYCIPYDYYINTILPLINKGAK